MEQNQTIDISGNSINSTNSTNINPDKLKDIMNKTQKDGAEKVSKLNSCEDDILLHDVLINIIKEGDAQFKAQTGRNMTYAEMRMMFG